jgi:hypothetical protein
LVLKKYNYTEKNNQDYRWFSSFSLYRYFQRERERERERVRESERVREREKKLNLELQSTLVFKKQTLRLKKDTSFLSKVLI